MQRTSLSVCFKPYLPVLFIKHFTIKVRRNLSMLQEMLYCVEVDLQQKAERLLSAAVYIHTCIYTSVCFLCDIRHVSTSSGNGIHCHFYLEKNHIHQSIPHLSRQWQVKCIIISSKKGNRCSMLDIDAEWGSIIVESFSVACLDVGIIRSLWCIIDLEIFLCIIKMSLIGSTETYKMKVKRIKNNFVSPGGAIGISQS